MFAIAVARALSRLSLRSLQSIGRALGWVPYLASRRYRRRVRANLAQAGFGDPGFLRAVVESTGSGALELAFIWMRPLEEVVRQVVEVRGYDCVGHAQARGRGIVFLAPHLGCFELAALWFGARFPFTVLYRPPRLAMVEPLMLHGRLRGHLRTATTDLSGVRKLIRALRTGDAVGLLPDQVPLAGMGEWADFFARPAYTSTLAARLVESTGAALIMAFCERLPRGGGYVLHVRQLELDPREGTAAAQLNRAVEHMIRIQPSQYLWSYNRYKTPRAAGASPARDGSSAAADQSRSLP